MVRVVGKEEASGWGGGRGGVNCSSCLDGSSKVMR